jgi:hypothetical protein
MSIIYYDWSICSSLQQYIAPQKFLFYTLCLIPSRLDSSENPVYLHRPLKAMEDYLKQQASIASEQSLLLLMIIPLDQRRASY